MEQTLKDLIADPAIQVRRLEAFLATQHGPVALTGKDGVERSLDMQGIDAVIPWSIRLDRAADLSAIQTELVASGWIPADLVLPPSMCLSDLQNLFELLDGYCPKLHYLSRRADWSRSACVVGDELDLLAVYFDTLLEIPEAELDGTRLMAYGASRIFDQYFLELERRQRARKPTLPLTRWWQNIIARLEERRPEGWVQVGLHLLSMPRSDQEQFAELMSKVKQDVLQGTKPLRDTVVFTPRTNRKIAVVGVAYVDATRAERNDRIERAASQARPPDGSSPDRVVVIACDPRIEGLPYSLLALVVFDQAATGKDPGREAQ